jgi:hypothetical protein
VVNIVKLVVEYDDIATFQLLNPSRSCIPMVFLPLPQWVGKKSHYCSDNPRISLQFGWGRQQNKTEARRTQTAMKNHTGAEIFEHAIHQ